MSVFCGQCGLEFATSALELEHVCKVTGVKPTDPKSMGANYEAIQKAAVARGEEEK